MTFDPSKGPGPATVERAVAAWQRARALLADDPDLASDEAAIQSALDADPGALTPDQLLTRITRALNMCLLRVGEATELSRAATARIRRYRKRAAILRDELLDVMVAFERKRFDAPDGTISVKAGVPSVVITDEESIPAEYIRLKREIDRVAIGADLKVGVVIDGAALANGPPTVAFRRDREFAFSQDDVEADVEADANA